MEMIPYANGGWICICMAVSRSNHGLETTQLRNERSTCGDQYACGMKEVEEKKKKVEEE
jgi:hypothetical protein